MSLRKSSNIMYFFSENVSKIASKIFSRKYSEKLCEINHRIKHVGLK